MNKLPYDHDKVLTAICTFAYDLEVVTPNKDFICTKEHSLNRILDAYLMRLDKPTPTEDSYLGLFESKIPSIEDKSWFRSTILTFAGTRLLKKQPFNWNTTPILKYVCEALYNEGWR